MNIKLANIDFGGISTASWGNITGDISDQTDLNEALSQYVTSDDFADTLSGYAQISLVQEMINTVSPQVPSTDGTYILKATVLNGEVTYEWVPEV